MKIADLHCDTLCTLTDNMLEIDNKVSMVNLDNLNNMCLETFACFASYPDNPYQRVNNLLKTYHKMLETNPTFVPVLNKADLAKPGLKTLLSVEEGGALMGDFTVLDEFYQQGVRLITLTWNYKNEIASPNNVKENIPNLQDGLTPFGVNLIKKMNELGIVIDISHLGDKGALEVLNLSQKPVIASHSNARSVCNHVRNLTDEMIKLIIQKKGFIGINFCKDFLTDKDEALVSDIIKHIDYIKSLGGIDVVGFGSDFDGISNDNIEMKDPSFFKAILAALYEHGYTEEETLKIAYKNAFDVLERILK